MPNAAEIEFKQSFIEHYKKLFFGTDRFVNREEPRIIGLLNDIGLSSSITESIFKKNAQRILKLKDNNEGVICEKSIPV